MLAWGFLIGSYTAMASARFSVELSPSFSINRIYCPDKPPICDKGGSVKIHLGAAYHFTLQEHCSLSTGLSYALGHIGWTRSASASTLAIDEEHFLQSIWAPILCRFYTSEIMIDTSIYCKLGLVPAIYLPTRPIVKLHPGGDTVLKMRPFSCLILCGMGIKYDFSLTNSLAVGLSYCWDVLGAGIIKVTSNNSAIYCHNHFACFDICVLF
ncbi:hypothetical protein [Candidatus Cardinium hertigii]|jgi:hypothetical protein|uniref:Outer membrane protein beta-barrel domain-containing protein n=1 Tax=Candidatus Cardinium hertigii TaxID=247481 RepID=A0A3N2QCF5_9BACT|nr:hypothetical protein [Candidatus Cardinium hertigii]ROT47451.1 hypothetical protein EDM02_02230 [Candidatus Cardinium hertigii]